MSLPRACLRCRCAARPGGARARRPRRRQPRRARSSAAAIWSARATAQSCHTVKQGQAFAGGLPIPTPFGVIYSPNITPDPDTGIGKWSKDDFWNAMHRRHRRRGQAPLSRVSLSLVHQVEPRRRRRDQGLSRRRVPAVKHQNMAPELPWPLSWRAVMAGWNLLYFRDGEYEPNPRSRAQWNRGAYLVEGAGHCAACHTPKNVLGATKTGDALQGGSAGEHWYAPSLTGDVRDGLGDWSVGGDRRVPQDWLQRQISRGRNDDRGGQELDPVPERRRSEGDRGVPEGHPGGQQGACRAGADRSGDGARRGALHRQLHRLPHARRRRRRQGVPAAQAQRRDPVQRARNRAPCRPRRREDGRHCEQAIRLGDARRSPRS